MMGTKKVGAFSSPPEKASDNIIQDILFVKRFFKNFFDLLSDKT